MELALNIGWAFLSFLAVCLLLHYQPSGSTNKRVQWIALFVLIAILFPVVSVSDDLFAAQNPAVTECGVDSKHILAAAPSVLSAIAGPPPPPAGDLSSRCLGWAVLKLPVFSTYMSWNQDSIQNRPPPSA